MSADPNINLALLPCTILKGVGQRLFERLQKYGIDNVQDLLFHLPFRYQDRTHVSPLGSLRNGDYAVIEGNITHAEVSLRKRAILTLYLKDSSGSLTVRFFHFNNAQKNNLTPGTKLRCFGEVRLSLKGIEMIHPEYRRILTDAPVPVEETLTPIYPTTEGLAQKTWRTLSDQALRLLNQGYGLQEFLPQELLKNLNFPTINAALQFVHRPPPDTTTTQLEAGSHPAQQRLAFEELLAHRLSLLQLRKHAQQQPAPPLAPDLQFMQQFKDTLPFQLTQAQQKVIHEVQQDLNRNLPMLRLVQGDVGSGKTMIAVFAMLQALSNHYQAALMAPTDILAEQHAHNFHQWLAPFKVEIAWLAGKHKGKTRQQTLEKIAMGNAKIIIGTHALFQDQVTFSNLGLVIIDEQHRFGVQQRLALREKSLTKSTINNLLPHQLIMTATPIPRTLAMTAYADLDVSVIDELPAGRKPIETVAVPQHKRDAVITRVKNACQAKRQAYWVCTLIEESEAVACQAAAKTWEELSGLLPELNIGLVHGRSKPQEKEATMHAFKAGQVDLLIATTVIEVGIDVPNATLMIIENAERLGLAQLHQLRGRVGRGSDASYCVLLYQTPLSDIARERIKTMRASNDGFVIAQKDLQLRGPGEVLGTRQTGLLKMRIADLRRDQQLLPLIQPAATQIMQQYPHIIQALITRWIAHKDKYAVV